ncbi:unnamed protein product [Didymodactylos carnosus]|uniref:Fungal lipase-type domain-containing protein n=2 Tax=Didymodactylos carnosus TaxID=1234261 RepID=A0A813W8W7_9BILA|nr:unnamed protein product [Didymodactylos carnosus]CAF3645147.1 unnamed protein product [Didymodactylos carnosus]
MFQSRWFKVQNEMYFARFNDEITKSWQSSFTDNDYSAGKIKNNVAFNKMPLRDPETILRMAEYQAMIYCKSVFDDLSVITNMATKNLRVGSFKLETTGYDYKHALFWYLASNQAQSSLILVHRGTSKQNADDVLVDLDVLTLRQTHPSLKQDFPYLNFAEKSFVAQGFHSRFKKEQQKVTEAVHQALQKYPTYSFIVVGHSLGAAWAYLNAGYFAGIPEYASRLSAVYTFGQPLLGDAAFVDALASKIGINKIVRVVNKDDLIPHIGCEKCLQPANVNEKWISNTNGPTKWIDCQGGYDETCSSGLECKDLSWENHSSVGNFSMRGEFCRIKANAN